MYYDLNKYISSVTYVYSTVCPNYLFLFRISIPFPLIPTSMVVETGGPRINQTLHIPQGVLCTQGYTIFLPTCGYEPVKKLQYPQCDTHYYRYYNTTIKYINKAFLSSIPCIDFSYVNIIVSGYFQVFDESISFCNFLRDSFHVRVRQISPKLILHKIFDIYQQDHFYK